MGYRLVSLTCPSCAGGVAAEGDDIVYYCTSCRNGYLLDPVAGQLQAVAVSFVALPLGRSARRHLPFWLLPAKVRLLERAAGASLQGLLHFFSGGEGGPPGQVGDAAFVVPAFPCSLANAVELAKRYTRELPRLGERIGERLTGGVLGVDDAKKLAEFVLIASEAEKPDTLTSLRYELRFGEPSLLGVPFQGEDGSLSDSIFGLPI